MRDENRDAIWSINTHAFATSGQLSSGHIPNWLRQNIQLWAYPNWLSPSGYTNGLPYTREIFGLVAMMPLTIWASLLHGRTKPALPLLLVINLYVYVNTPCYSKPLLIVLKHKCRSA